MYRKVFKPVAFLLCLAFLLAACSPAAAPTQAPQPAKPAVATKPPPPPAAKPQAPVVVVQGVEPPTLDPQFHESGALANVSAQMFDCLIGFDRDMKIVPELAESYKLLPDNVTWQFKLRKGVKFWNGEPMDAKAVKFTYDRMGNQELRTQGLSDPYYGRVGFDHIDIVDDLTVNFVLKKPNLIFLVYTTFPPILAPKYYTENSPKVTAIKPMGTGPWMFKEWIKDDHITLVANPDYWGGKPEIETIIIKPVPEASTRMAMLEAGEADVVGDLSPEDIVRVGKNEKLRVSKVVGGRRVGIVIPPTVKEFKDPRVRQAMNYAVDFDAINKSILGGLAYGRMVVPVNGEFWMDPNLKPYTYDPEKAKALLKEANWNSNYKFNIYTTVGRYMKDKEIVQAVAGYLNKVGMLAEALPIEYSVFSERNSKSLFDGPFIIGLGSRFYGPEDLQILFEKGFQGYEWQTETQKGPEAKKIFDQLMVTFDEKKQQELVYQVSKLFYEESTWIFLWKQVSVFGVSKRLDWEGAGNTRIDFWYPGAPKPAGFAK